MRIVQAEDTRSIEPLLNTIIEGDCLEKMKAIPDESIDMVLCDLPYGTTQNKWDSIINLDILFTEYRRVIKPRGVIALTSSGLFTAKLMLHAADLYKYKLVWVKSKATNFLNAKKQPLRKYEDICIFYRSQPTYHPQMSQGESYDKGVRKNQLTGSYGDFDPKHVQSDGRRYPTDNRKAPCTPPRRSRWSWGGTSFAPIPTRGTSCWTTPAEAALSALPPALKGAAISA